MSHWVTLTSREVGAFFLSVMAYVVLVVFSFLVGWDFSGQLQWVSGFQGELPAQRIPLSLFGGGLPILLLLFVAPLITMRLLAEEKRNGTLETLMTAPVTDFQVVWAKFTAGMICYLALWVPSIVALFAVSQWSGELDAGPILSGLLGVSLVGGMFIAAGLFASSTTSNQIVAAVIGIVINLALYIVPLYSLGGGFVEGNPYLKRALEHMNLAQHLQNFALGLIDTSTLVYLLSMIALFLFLTIRSLEARKWS